MADKVLIDELIKFCDEKSKNIKLKAEPQVFIEIKQALEELKNLKLSKKGFITIGQTVEEFEKEIRAKAIDEFVEKLKKLSKGHKYVNAEDGTTINEMTSNENMEKKYAWHLSNNQCCDWFCNRLDEVAEQLKDGGENE